MTQEKYPPIGKKTGAVRFQKERIQVALLARFCCFFF
jgi:hypothetical protein